MELAATIEQILKTYNERKDDIQTEEATKMSLIVPFIAALGYNVFDPGEVVPEFTADIGTKKGEKIDYAIKRDGQILMLVECKAHTVNLSDADRNQLLRYFVCLPDTRIAVLTNGLQYKFYTDIDKYSILDAEPYFQFDIRAASGSDIRELTRYCKPEFNVGKIQNNAAALKIKGNMKRYITEQFANPDVEFAKIIAKASCPAIRMLPSVAEYMAKILQIAINEFLNDQINSRLSSAMRDDFMHPEETGTDEQDESRDGRQIVTTQDEIDGFNIVRAILSEDANADDVVMRDTFSYCGILFKDNNRTPICRLYFNNPSNLRLALLDAEKKETRVNLSSVNDIYQYSTELRKTLGRYLKG
jgi:hypothetical protein